MGILEGKCALVTGAGGGIGRATASILAAEGAHVACSDLTLDRAAQTAEEIVALGGTAIALQGDVSHNEDVARLVEQAVAKFGVLDCAVNNAGLGSGQVGMKGVLLADWTEEAFDRIIQVNLKGVWLCMKHQITHMVKQQSGVIINMSSIAGIKGLSGVAGYAAAKHGVVGLTKGAAREYGPQGLRINVVCPGSVLTPMAAAQARGPKAGGTIGPIPLDRSAGPDEIARLVAFLCSDSASYISGSVISIDGGASA